MRIPACVVLSACLALPSGAAASQWRGEGRDVQVALELKGRRVTAELASDNCSAPTLFTARMGPARFDRRWRLHWGGDVLRRRGDRIVGTVTFDASGGRCVVRSHVSLVPRRWTRDGAWRGTTVQGTPVGFSVDHRGLVLGLIPDADGVVTEETPGVVTALATCPDGRRTEVNWGWPTLIRPDGSFAPEQLPLGTITGRLSGTTARGTTQMNDGDCHTGVVAWNASLGA